MDKVSINKVVMIPIDRIHPNEFNPNVQSPSIFNRLVEEIREDGFDHPLQVVPWPEWGEPGDPPIEYAEGKFAVHFKIIGGEHRHKAAIVLEMKAVPCVVYDSWDEELQRIKTVRRNLLSGDLDDRKFTALVASLKTTNDTLTDNQLAELFGFESESDFAKHVIAEIAEDSAADRTWLKDMMKETEPEVDAVNAMTDVLHNIFSQYGETVPQAFMFFSYKGKTHLMSMMSGELNDEVEKMVAHLKATGTNINTYLLEKLREKKS